MLANMLGSNALALQEKVINSEGPCYVRLVGRKSGLIDWLLTLLGINTRTMLEIYEDRIEYSYGSLSGRVLEVILFLRSVIWFVDISSRSYCCFWL